MGRQTALTKPKEADVPCHTRLSTHAPSTTQGRNGLVGSRARVKEFCLFVQQNCSAYVQDSNLVVVFQGIAFVSRLEMHYLSGLG